jgi:LuxR family maltose regulon positive regulatory protein
MARSTPRVHEKRLELPATHEGKRECIDIDSLNWYAWLENNRVFRFESDTGSFTARKERRPRGWYWYAYRRIQGMLHIAYLGRSQELTFDLLNAQARHLALSKFNAHKPDLHILSFVQTDQALLLTKLLIPQVRNY